MAPKNTDTSGTADSPTVVNVALRSYLNGAVYGRSVSREPVKGVDASGVVKVSAVGSKPLNAAVTIRTADALEIEDATGASLVSGSETQILRAKPTADYLRKKSTSMKSGRKMIIKVDPPPQNENESKVVPGLVFDKFSLQAVTESDEERYQLHETFAEEVLFVFGRRPRVWSLAGIVINSDDANYADELIESYNNYYRGTRVIDNQMRTFVFYEDVMIEGTLLGLTVQRSSQIPGAVNATITLVVHERGIIGQNDGGDENLAEFLAAANASLSGDVLEPDQILSRKPSAAAVSDQAAQTSAVEVAVNAKVAELEKQLSDAASDLLSTEDSIRENEEFLDQAMRTKAEEEAAGQLEEAALTQELIDDAERENTELRSRKQEQESVVDSLAEQVVAEKKNLTDAAAKGDVQSASATAAAAAEGAAGSTSSSVVTVSGVAREQDEVIVVELDVTYESLPASTSAGGVSDTITSDLGAIENLYSDVLASYGVSFDRDDLLRTGNSQFSGTTTGRVL